MAVGCAEPAATAPATAPLIPSGEARVWFYRPWEPSESFNLARIDMNDSYVGAVENGGAFYRDVPARALSHRARELWSGYQPGQKRRPRPGQQLYVKVVSLESWGASVSSCKNCARDAFYAWLIPPEVAQVEIARDRNGI